jgi:hypothetical protein
MRMSSALVAFAGAAAGVVGGVSTYHSSAAVTTAPDHTGSPVLAVGRPLPAAPARVERRKADCVAPAVLERGVCVTHVVKAVAAPPAPAAPTPATPAHEAAAAPGARRASTPTAPTVVDPCADDHSGHGGDDGVDDGGSDHSGHGGDDSGGSEEGDDC